MPPRDKPFSAEAWEALAGAAQGDAHKLAALARGAEEQGQLDRAYALARQARALAPADPEVAATTSDALHRGVPGWHVQMVREAARNNAWRDAIERAVTPGMRVLDIGAGTGLLAMIAARAGAGQVFSCEANPAIADAAEEIVAANGFADRIRVLRQHSRTIDPAALGGPVDLLVSEIIASDLLQEQVLPAVADASRRLLRPGGTMIPRGGAVRVALAHWGKLEHKLLDEALGFDVTGFNHLVALPHRAKVGDPSLVLRSPAATLFDFDFTRAVGYRGGRTRLTLTADGPVNGIVQWIRVRLDAATVYENRPRQGIASAWFAPFWPLAREAAAGEKVTVAGRYTSDAVLIWDEAGSA